MPNQNRDTWYPAGRRSAPPRTFKGKYPSSLLPSLVSGLRDSKDTFLPWRRSSLTAAQLFVPSSLPNQLAQFTGTSITFKHSAVYHNE